MAAVVNGKISFGEFEVDPDRRLLMRNGQKVPLKAKTFDVLLVLVQNRGDVVSKSELMDRVWENQFVEENNLTVHVAALRKALGETKNENRYIVTVPGTGYTFVAPVDDSFGEMVIERHSLSRIVVEEQIEESTDGPKPAIELSSGQSFRSLGWIAGISVAILLAIFAGGWYYRTAGVPSNTRVPTAFTARAFTAAGGGMPDSVAISPDGRTIAFVQRKKGRYSLHLGELEASNSVEIIPPTDRLYRYLAFAPDGKSIYFTARDENHLEPALMRVSILGGVVQDLVDEVHSGFTFSPDGRLLAYRRTDVAGNKTSLVTADAMTGRNEQVLLALEGTADVIGAGVSWSPDGTRIAFAGATQQGHRLMTIEVGDRSVSDLGNAVPNRIVHVTWLPDQSGVVTIRNSDPHPNDGQVWFVSYPSGEEKLLTDETLTYSFSNLSVSTNNTLAVLQTRSDPQIAVSNGDNPRMAELILSGARSRAEGMNGVFVAPDGKILYTAVVNDSRTIWEMDPDGSGQRQLTPVQRNSADEQIVVTPDNRYLIFQSERTGDVEVWRANRDGTSARPLTSEGGNRQPAITPDGAWVVYASLRNGKYGLRRIPIEGGEPISITESSLAAENSLWPDVSPDGRLIAFSYGRTSRYPNREMRIIPFEGGPPVKTFQVPLAAVLYNRLRWSPDGQAIIFKDHTQGLWRQDLSSDRPREVESPDDLRIYHFAYTRDGTMVYSGGNQMREIILLERSNPSPK